MAEHGCKPSMDFDIVSADTGFFNNILSSHIYFIAKSIDPTLAERSYTDADCDAGFTAVKDTIHEINWVGDTPCNIRLPDQVKSGTALYFVFTATGGVNGGDQLIFTCGNDDEGNQTYFAEGYIYFKNTASRHYQSTSHKHRRHRNNSNWSEKEIIANSLKLTIQSSINNNQFDAASYIGLIYHDGDHGYQKGWYINFEGYPQGTGAAPTSFNFTTS